MKLVRTISEAREWVAEQRSAGRSVGLVPTLGYLHAGHESLIEIAAGRCDAVVVSIFVNPLQFGPDEDFERYPRNLDRDLEIAGSKGADLVFAPTTAEMYPAGEPWIHVEPGQGADRLCGASRPGHFRGVLTVVAKLFGIITPDLAVFGRKDFQQLVLIRRMTYDLNMGIEIVGAPIVREADGLALSSRNTYLGPEERRAALRLSAALNACGAAFRAGERSTVRLESVLREADGDGVRIEYAEVVDPETLERIAEAGPDSVAVIAARVGGTRLIDNLPLGSET